MPIYDQSYRPYRGSFSSHATRCGPITRTGVFHFLRRRLSLAGYSACAAIAWGLLVLALSSMSKNSRYVGILFLSLAFFTSGFAQFLRGIFNRDGIIVISGVDSLKLLTYLFFGGISEYGDHSFGAAVSLLLLSIASVLVL